MHQLKTGLALLKEEEMKRILISLIALGLASCDQAPKTVSQTPQAMQATKPIEYTDARVRLAPNGMDMTAGYLTVKNNSDKPIEIIGASTDIADHIELHTHIKTNDGMMSMQQVEKFDVPAKGNFELAPNGAHLMIFGVKPNLKEGDAAKITLKIKDNPDLIVDAKLVANPNIEIDGMKKDGNNKAEHSH